MVEFETVQLEAIPNCNPVRDFSEFWHDKKASEDFFLWSRFDPMQVPSVLPWMLLLDCLENGDYQYKLCGSGCEELLKVNLTGQKFGTAVRKDWAEDQRKFFDAMRRGSAPIYSNGFLPIEGRDHIRVFRGLFGFSAAGNGVDRLVAVLAPDRRQPTLNGTQISLPLHTERRSQSLQT